MFTGIIEEIGIIQYLLNNKVCIKCQKVIQSSSLGDSIAVNGVCLTITEIGSDYFTADISNETYNVTTFAKLKNSDYVNLERALSASARFGGHIVTGHIDALAKVLCIERNSNFMNLKIELPEELSKYTVNKGSVAINGISLTIANSDKNIISVAVIPHSYENTNLKYLKVYDFVNIEVDILSKYVEKFLSTSDNKARIDMEFLRKNGF